MTKEELLEILNNNYGHDYERAHVEHDEALLAYMDDEEITTAFNLTTKWYA